MRTADKFLVVLAILGLMLVWAWFPELKFKITGLVSQVQPTTANVTVKGILGDVFVGIFPVNFSTATGLTPGTANNTKQNVAGYIVISLNETTNTNWDLYINGSAMTGTGYSMAVSNIKVNSTCNITYTPPVALITLSTSLTQICSDTYQSNTTEVWFYLDVPTGQYNTTYNGDLWIWVNNSAAENNQSWYGEDNTTVTIRKNIEFNLYLVPINFTELSPGAKGNATANFGWPANVSIGTNTNIFSDIYINGSDLTESGGGILESDNITYSNATSEANWPDNVKTLNNTLPDSSTNGDFANWGNLANETDNLNWWNISIPSGQTPGDYGGSINVKVVEAGADPISA